MKRYYTSFLRYNLLMMILPVLSTIWGITTIVNIKNIEGFFKFFDIFFSLLMFISAIFMLVHVYRLFKKLIYVEINKESIIYSYGRGKKIYEYSDTKHYTIKRSGKYKNLYIHSIKKEKKHLVPLLNYDINYDEFVSFLSDNSGKEIYYKDYGEEPKLIR